MEIKENAFGILCGFNEVVIESLAFEFEAGLIGELHPLDLGNVAIDLGNLENGFQIFFPLIWVQLGQEIFVLLALFRDVKLLHAAG